MKNSLLSCSSIVGTEVKNRSNEKLGVVKELMINTHKGEICYAVLSFGGVLGIGDKYFAIPWESLYVDKEDEIMILDVSKEVLENSPGFDKDNWPSSAKSEYLMKVKEYYN